MMEARRLEKQRRESTKSAAASQLPSSQEQEFNLRLLNLFREQPCLWNTSLPEHGDVELKGRAWKEIATQMGSHLDVGFIRCRMRSLRYKLNLYRLQLIEFQMTSGMGMPPEKPYFLDHFGFLDAVEGDAKEPSPGESVAKAKPETTSGMLSKLLTSFTLKKLPEAGNKLTKDAPAAQRSGSSIANMVKERLETKLVPPGFNLPRVQPRQRKSAQLPGPSSSASSVALSETPADLEALPGESISGTRLAWKRRMLEMQQKEQQHLDGSSERPSTSRAAQLASRREESVGSEDEELYNFHWNMRRERRSLRPGAAPPGKEKAPRLPTEALGSSRTKAGTF